MQLIETIAELKNWQQENSAKTIGLIPTMGALHRGHLSLIEASKVIDDLTICSIFVNPTQFNEASDLEKYPRTLQKDIQGLYKAGADAVFIPEIIEIYPKSGFELPTFQLDQLTNVLEGTYRPGHFDGVVQVVYRLLDLVQPSRLYMGLKDFQQQAIIGEMLRQMKSAIELVPCPIIRATDGLAMSSRNRRLSEEERAIAPNIYETLQGAKQTWKAQFAPSSIKANATQQLEKAGFKVDYFEIVDATTLEEIKVFDESANAIICVAAWLGGIRLIDNLEL